MDSRLTQHQRLRRVWAPALAITILATQSVTLAMALALNSSEEADWNEEMDGIQGSLDRLTDIFASSMMTPEDGTITQRNQAIRFLQEVDDGLSTNDKVKMVSLFMNNIVVADMYISLMDIDIRRAWLHAMLMSDTPSTNM